MSGNIRFSKGALVGVCMCLTIVLGRGVLKEGRAASSISPQTKYLTLTVEEKLYPLTLEAGRLCWEKGKGDSSILVKAELVDATTYDLDKDGVEELIVLTQNKEEGKSAFGKELQVYTVVASREGLEATFLYGNNIGSVQPFRISAGSLLEGESHIYVGVHKATVFHEETMNRPFFFTWNGAFIEQKWTGSYLSKSEPYDVLFIDVSGDGQDEIAVLEKELDGTYQVSLYNWLGFGFQHLTTSTTRHKAGGRLGKAYDKGKVTISVQYSDGEQEVVEF